MHIAQPTLAHEPDEADPVKELEERNQALARIVAEKIRDLQAAHDELECMAVTDKLTNLPNQTKLQVTDSFGIAIFQPGDTIRTLFLCRTTCMINPVAKSVKREMRYDYRCTGTVPEAFHR
jgi:hypothetical protein